MPGAWETNRLLLRELGPEHAAPVRAYGLRSLEYHFPWDPTRPADYWQLPVVAERLRGQIEEGRRGMSLCLFLSPKTDPGVVIGAVNTRNIIRGALQSAHVGYALAPDAVGQGFMTEAVRGVVGIAFGELGLHRLEINVMPHNERSLGVAERAGFSREGYSPRYLRINGRWEDHVRYARINEAAL
ncbi:MAG: GNAT family N-acetyltransferase [Coriobacteriia bacterium]|nr:GNAT family N-acetyltransferase [Coriobacteriia bacterium]